MNRLYLDEKLQDLKKIASKGETKVEKPSVRGPSERIHSTSERIPSTGEPTGSIFTKEGTMNDKTTLGDTILPSILSDSSSKAPRVPLKIQNQQQDNPTQNSALPTALMNLEPKSSHSVVSLAGFSGLEAMQEPVISLITTESSQPLYHSGHVVAIGDVVVRRRDLRTIANGSNKLDKVSRLLRCKFCSTR